MKKKPIHVLFTAAGGAGTIYILKKLQGLEEYRTTTVDMNPYAVGLQIANSGYVVPVVTSSEYFNVIKKIVKKEKIDIIVPLIDEELLGMANFGVRMKIAVLLPQKGFILMCLDKLKTSRELQSKNILSPKTWSHDEFKKMKDKKNFFPKIIKPRNSRGSRGFMSINSYKDYHHYLNNSSFAKEKLIFQEPIKGREYTISVIVKKDGKIIAIVSKEVIEKKGITKIGVTRRNKAIEEVCRKIQEKFQANGPFNVQLIINEKDKKPYIHEINPRFSTTVALTIESGINEVDILIKDRLNIRSKTPKFFKKNLIMIRYEDQVFINEKKLKVKRI